MSKAISQTPGYRIKKNIPLIFIFIILFGFGNGCAVGPNYKSPDLDVPSQYQTSETKSLDAVKDPAKLAKWWDQFNDPVLSNLINRGAKENINLKEALARVRQARARRQINRSDFFPSVAATASETTSKSGNNESRNIYSAGIDAGWEIDIFGKTRRSVEAATADANATNYGYQDVLVSLAAEIALNYVDFRTLQAQLASTRKNINILTETYALTQAKHSAGLETALDAKQAESNLEVLRASLPNIETNLAKTRFRIAVLIGEYPGAVDAVLSEYIPLPDIPEEVTYGIPANLLSQRPDIRMAEQNLAAQTARIGVVMADRYPSVVLFGSIGLDALKLSDLFTADSTSRSAGPRISLPVFNAGALKNAVIVQESITDQAFYQYQATVLSAVEEVENALMAFTQSRQRRVALKIAQDAAAESYAIAGDQFVSGLVDYQRVIDTQRSLFSINDQVIQNQGDVVSNLIRIYKALGGGWSLIEADDTKTGTSTSP